MMHLYLTTDSIEAETLIEDTELGQEPKYNYHDFDFEDSLKLSSKIGFNPMSSVEMNGEVSENQLEKIATKLVKEGLCVATEFKGKIKKYFPKDLELMQHIIC